MPSAATGLTAHNFNISKLFRIQYFMKPSSSRHDSPLSLSSVHYTSHRYIHIIYWVKLKGKCTKTRSTLIIRLKNTHKRGLHSSPMRPRYGASFVIKSDVHPLISLTSFTLVSQPPEQQKPHLFWCHLHQSNRHQKNVQNLEFFHI